MRYEAATDVIDDSIMSLPPQHEDIGFAFDREIREARKSQTRAAAHRLGGRVRALAGMEANWDGRGSAAASEAAVYPAIGVIYGITQAVQEAGLPWLDPHIGLDERGYVVFEWWNDRNKLTVYVGEEEIEYVSSWGPDIDAQMDAGSLHGDNFLSLWKWLTLPPE